MKRAAPPTSPLDAPAPELDSSLLPDTSSTIEPSQMLDVESPVNKQARTAARENNDATKPSITAQRQQPTLAQRLQIIKLAREDKLTHGQIAERMNMSKPTVSRTLGRADFYEAQHARGVPLNVRRFRGPTKSTDMDRLLWDWFKVAHSNGAVVTGSDLKNEARRLANELGVRNFKASNGWLDRFRVRYQIGGGYRRVTTLALDCGRKDSFHVKSAVFSGNGSATMAEILNGYKDQDVWALDETTLRFALLPSQESALTVPTDDSSSDHMMLLLCASMAGERYDRPFVVYDKYKPAAFAGLQTSELFNALPVHWAANDRAELSAANFAQWLQEFDAYIGRLGERQVLLFLSTAAAHMGFYDVRTSHIRVVFVPAHLLPRHEPFKQGIIREFKLHYRKSLVEYALNQFQQTGIDELLAVRLIQRAWSSVAAHRVRHSFARAGFARPNAGAQMAMTNGNVERFARQELASLANLMNKYLNKDENEATDKSASLTMARRYALKSDDGDGDAPDLFDMDEATNGLDGLDEKRGQSVDGNVLHVDLGESEGVSSSFGENSTEGMSSDEASMLRTVRSLTRSSRNMHEYDSQKLCGLLKALEKHCQSDYSDSVLAPGATFVESLQNMQQELSRRIGNTK